MTDPPHDERWAELRNHCWRPSGEQEDEGWAASPTGDDWGDLKLLVVGAGGLGCEILKDLALIGFRDMEVIDMDEIDLSNLNRQFLFREKDIGKPKAKIAAEFVMNRVADVEIKWHHCMIQDMDNDFYRQFACIVLGLDSLTARRWINAKIAELTTWEEGPDGTTAVPSSTIPMIDGGTEGFKGHARVVMIGSTACIESTEWMFPPQVSYPMCTLENVPRLPEHCVMYIKEKEWRDSYPFGKGVEIDGDNEEHIMWIAGKAAERGAKHGIDGITYPFTQGVVKNIIPAIASTNAIIAAACCNEVLKMATNCNAIMDNYFLYNGNSIDHGVYGQVQSFPPDASCSTSAPPTIITASRSWTPREFVQKCLVGKALNSEYEPYVSDAKITLQSPVAGVLLAPEGSLISTEVTTSLGDLNLDDDGDTSSMLFATDPTFWKKDQYKMLVKFED
eukprot:TRINITY_DN7091_c0_g1_i1.p1 TRINITY_DN7091_c0_g1~~TRINITY_DN7091_c0_g1_i1.p1  ORF type:complete len:448 (+),score=85.93 TRINITY_DN7091_c0_g1_i1:80-1423(+)